MDVAVVSACLVLIALVWAAILERSRFERADAISDAMTQTSNLAIAYEEHTVRTLKSIDQLLQFVRYAYQATPARRDMQALLRERVIDDSLFDYIGVLNANGNLTFSSRDANRTTERTNLADAESFTFHQGRNSDELLVGKPLLGRLSGRWIIPISRRISRRDGSFGGIVYATLRPVYFTDFYQKANLGALDVISLLGRDGIVRAQRIGPTTGFGRDMRSSTLYSKMLKEGSGSLVTLGKGVGTRRFESYRSLNAYPLVIAVGISESDVLAPVERRNRAYLAGGALFSAIVLILGGGMIVARWRQRRSRDALSESEARYRATFDQAAVGIAYTSVDGRYLMVNQRLCAMLGYSRDELLAMRKEQVAPANDTEDASELLRLLSGRIDTYAGEKQYLRKDGSVLWVHRAVSAVRDRAGKPLYLVRIIQDISEHKWAEGALLESEQRLRRALDERERISQDLHDGIVQMIYAVGLGLEQVRRMLGADADAAKQGLTEAIARLNQVISEVRSQILNLAPFGVDAEQLRGELAAIVKGADVVDGMHFSLDADPVALSQLPPKAAYEVINIVREAVSNSLRHSGGRHGAVTVRSGTGVIRLAITDDGKGFDLNKAGRNVRGLANIAARAQLLSAQLDVRGAPGQGTSVVLDIPLEEIHDST